MLLNDLGQLPTLPPAPAEEVLSLPVRYATTRVTPGRAPDYYAQRAAMDARRELACKLFEAMRPGQVYTVRLTERTCRQPQGDLDRFLCPDLWPLEHTLEAEVGVARTMELTFARTAPLSLMPWGELNRTAASAVAREIHRRLHRTGQRMWAWFQEHTGWHP